MGLRAGPPVRPECTSFAPVCKVIVMAIIPRRPSGIAGLDAPEDDRVAGRFNQLGPRTDALKILAREFRPTLYVGLALRVHADRGNLNQLGEPVFKIAAIILDEGVEAGIGRRFSAHRSAGLLKGIMNCGVIMMSAFEQCQGSDHSRDK